MASDLSAGVEIDPIDAKVAIGAFVLACLLGVIEIKLRRKWGGRMYPPEHEKLIVPLSKQVTPLMGGLFVFGYVAGIFWIAYGEEVGIGLGILFLTMWAVLVMGIIRALNRGLPVSPPAETPDAGSEAN